MPSRTEAGILHHPLLEAVSDLEEHIRYAKQLSTMQNTSIFAPILVSMLVHLATPAPALGGLLEERFACITVVEGQTCLGALNAMACGDDFETVVSNCTLHDVLSTSSCTFAHADPYSSTGAKSV